MSSAPGSAPRLYRFIAVYKERRDMKSQFWILTISIFVFMSLAHATYVPRRVQYMGRTTLTFTSNLGGTNGANTKCQVNFPNSHMCTEGELRVSGVTSFVATGWIACDSVSYEFDGVSNWLQCRGVTGYATQTTWESLDTNFTNGGINCWASAADSAGRFVSSSCSTARVIHCCL